MKFTLPEPSSLARGEIPGASIGVSPPEIVYCSRQVCHGAASIAASLRDLKNNLITSLEQRKSSRVFCLERICQQEGQLVFLRDIIQFAGFEGQLSQACVGWLSAIRAHLDSARSELAKGAIPSSVESGLGFISLAIRDLEELATFVSRYISKPLLAGGPPKDDALDTVLRICRRFPYLVRELANESPRRARREGLALNVNDEYDLQQLLLAILHLHFEDVRCEEPTPSHAGGGSRMDFLLMPEGIVVETKKTRKDLKDRDLIDQLIVDVERYSVHGYCRKLVCFVFDPELFIRNPKGLERDLSKEAGAIDVFLIISPQHM